MKKINFKYLLAILIMPLIWFGWMKFYPNELQVYAKNIQGELNGLAGQIHYYQNSFSKVNSMLEQTQTDFYEIRSIVSYEDSVKDTAKDIQNLEKLLNTLENLLEKRKLEKPPVGAEKLANDLTNYYETLKQPLEILLRHEKLQQRLLQASGDEFNSTMAELGSESNNEAATKLYIKLSLLAEESLTNIRKIEIPEDEALLFKSVVFQHELLADYFGKIANLIQEQPSDFQKKFEDSTREYQEQAKIAGDSQADVDLWFETTPIIGQFEKASELELEVTQEIELINSKNESTAKKEKPAVKLK